MTTPETPAAPRNTEEQLVGGFIRSLEDSLIGAERTPERTLDEQIHIALGWKKIAWPQRPGQDTIGCEDGWCWESPTGSHYEGHLGMVPHYMRDLREAVRVLPAALAVLASNNGVRVGE